MDTSGNYRIGICMTWSFPQSFQVAGSKLGSLSLRALFEQCMDLRYESLPMLMNPRPGNTE